MYINTYCINILLIVVGNRILSISELIPNILGPLAKVMNYTILGVLQLLLIVATYRLENTY